MKTIKSAKFLNSAVNFDDYKGFDLPEIVKASMKADVIHPVYTTMLPKSNKKLKATKQKRNFKNLIEIGLSSIIYK